jgi:hypothetical protein
MARSLKHLEEVEDGGRFGSNVSLLPSFTQIPELEFAASEKAQLLYAKWGHILYSRGLLNEETLGWINSLVSWTDELDRARSRGNSIRHPQQSLDSVLRKLTALYDSGPISTAASANPYANFGFAQRARQRRHRTD